MFTLSILHITMIYIFLVLLLLIVVIWSKLWWKWKAALMVSSLLFLLTSYYSLSNLLGYPSTIMPPKNFLFIAAHIQPPDQQKNKKGTIYLWILDNEIHRLHEMDYSPLLHRKIAKAQSLRNRGLMVKIHLKQSENDLKHKSSGRISYSQKITDAVVEPVNLNLPTK